MNEPKLRTGITENSQFKDGDHTDLKNYQPICILRSLSKVFEDANLEELTGFFNKHDALSPCQSGFVKGWPPIDAIGLYLVARHIFECVKILAFVAGLNE